MELDPHELTALARRWSALADDLVAAATRARATPTPDPDEQGLLDAVAGSLSGVARDVDRLVDGLLLTVREVVEADRQVADALLDGRR